MSNRDQDDTLGSLEPLVRKPDQTNEGVFDDNTAPKPDPKTDHPGVHGADGRENDLDRAEDAGREDGRR